MQSGYFMRMPRLSLRTGLSEEEAAMENQKGFELDLLGLFRYLKKKIWIILIVIAVCAGLSFVISRFVIAQQYTATTRAYVLNRSGEDSVVSSDFALSNYMISDYKVLITGQNVTDEVIAALGLDMTHEELTRKISVSAESNTRVLQISVTDTDPRRAADIANSVREVASAQIKQIMAVDAVNLVYAAMIPSEPSSPNIIKTVVLSAVMGMVLSIIILTVIFVSDDTIATEEEVEYYLGLSTMGVIPLSDGLGKTRRAGIRKGLYESGFLSKRRNTRC